MNRPLISIIVAIYNVEEFLPKCIESIQNQTYANFELILVVDGSPDNSLQICNEYASMDNRIKVVCKDNGGQATARNAGLDRARGCYIGFVDGDDWIEPEMYQSLYELIRNENADIAQCGWYTVDRKGNKTCNTDLPSIEKYTSFEALEMLISSSGGHLNTSVCSKLFSKRIIGDLRFSPVRAYEDDEFVFKTVSNAHKIVCVSTPLYNYFCRPNSTMTADFNMNKLALVTIQKSICELVRQCYPQRFHETQKILCSKQFYILERLLKYKKTIPGAKEESEKLQADILKSQKEYMSNPSMGLNKIMLVLMKYFPAFIWQTVLHAKFRN